MKYELVESAYTSELTDNVNSLCRKGYKPLGGVSTYLYRDTVNYIQVMVLEDDEDHGVNLFVIENRDLKTELAKVQREMQAWKEENNILTGRLKEYEKINRETGKWEPIKTNKVVIPNVPVDELENPENWESQDMRELNDNYPHGE